MDNSIILLERSGYTVLQNGSQFKVTTPQGTSKTMSLKEVQELANQYRPLNG